MERFTEHRGDYVAPIAAGIAALLMTTIATLTLYLFHVSGDEFLLLFLILGLLTIWRSHRYHRSRVDPRSFFAQENGARRNALGGTLEASRRMKA